VPGRRAVVVGERARARLDVDSRRRQLVTLGAKLFSSHAYDEVSIDDLARSARISRGLLYHYFPTKRDFYVATVRAAATELLEKTSASKNTDPIERLRRGLDAYLAYVVRHRKAYASLLRGGVGVDKEVARIVDETRDAFQKRLVLGAPFDARKPLARLALRGWVGFVEAATLEWLETGRPAKPVPFRDMLVQVLLDAVETAASP
jgi:AcrR family transcriptional regulator